MSNRPGPPALLDGIDKQTILLIEVVCGDTDELLTVVNDAVRKVPGVRSTETFTYLHLQKQTHSWGAP